MATFFTDNISSSKITITGEDVLHIKKVLRHKDGDVLKICDGRGTFYSAKILDIAECEISCEIIDTKKADTEPELEVTLYQGLPKASKMDYIIQKTTELGILNIVPVALSRCVVKLEGKKAEEKKCERWQKISSEAAKQCGRGVIPKVFLPMTLDEVIEDMKKCDLSFALYEAEEERNLKKILTTTPNVKKLSFLVGPEGGLADEEVEKLKKAGIASVGLGKRILRTETAGEAALSMIMYELGDINK